MKCAILCAGRGHRMGSEIPTVLIPINRKPMVCHVMDMWKNAVDGFIFVVGHKWEEVVASLPKGAPYIIQEPQKGIADAIYSTKGLLKDEEFVVVLGDCLHVGEWDIPSNIKLGIGVWETTDKDAIRKGYSVEIENNLVTKVVEKPKNPPNNYCGMGTYFLDGRIFNYIKRTKLNPIRNEREITDTIKLMIDAGEPITPVFFNGKYLNINYWNDIAKAEDLLR